jgi:glycosyltransferase involved in cell wall biosynthesis
VKVLHYFSRVRLSIGGTVRAALDMSVAQARRGHEVTLATIDDTDASRALEGVDSPPRVLRLPAPRGLMGRWTSAQFREVRNAVRGLDVAHIHAVWAPTNPQIAAACRAEGVPYVVTAHGMLDDWAISQKAMKKRLYMALWARRMLRDASAVHFTANEEMRQSMRWLPRDNAVSIPLLFDAGEYADLPGEELARARFGLEGERRPILLFLSRLSKGKRADLVIGAARELRAMGVDALTVIAGAGDPDEEAPLREMVRRDGLEDCVRFVGSVYGREKVSLYQCARVFALPSDHENFCFALVEAMAAGAPAITVRTVAIWEELVESGGALAVDADPAAIARAAADLLRDGALARAMGDKARRFAMETMSEARVAPRYESMYLAAMEGT